MEGRGREGEVSFEFRKRPDSGSVSPSRRSPPTAAVRYEQVDLRPTLASAGAMSTS